MFTQSQAAALQQQIYKEVPGVDVQIQSEQPPYIYHYYLIVFREGKLRFVVRSETQWQERKRLLLA